MRFATEPYSTDPKNINHKFVHLTNFSINKKNTKFVKNDDKHAASDSSDEQKEASKWDFKQLEQAF